MARTGMAALIEELRGMAEAGTSEYTIGTTLYWSDNAIQDVLDIHRLDLTFAQIAAWPVRGLGGTLQYYEYRSPYGFLEATTGGSSIFYIQDSAGATLGTSLWGADYRRGVVTFNSDTKGTAFYITGRSYDMNAAAGYLWRMKSSHYAPTSFDFSTDNHSISRQQVYQHCTEMANYFNGISREAVQTVQRWRSDINGSY